MAISQPLSTDFLDSPDHSALHRIIAADVAAAVQSLVVDSDGNVGIGTTGPLAKLEIGDIVTNTDAFGIAVKNPSTYDYHHLYLEAKDNSDAISMGHSGTQAIIATGWTGGTGANTPMIIRSSGTNQLYLNTDGRIGINDAGPDAMLDIVSNAAATPVLRLEHAASASSDYLQIASNGAGGGDIVTIQSNGNVGIGITAPLAKLHIDQATSDAAIPVLSLDQADISDGFINFIGATAASAAGPISSWTTGNAIEGFVRVEINGVQKWMPYYGDPTG